MRRRRPEVPSLLADIVDCCLQRNPAERFQSHHELLRAVRHAIPQPVVAPTPLVRALAGALDLLPALAVLNFTFARAMWAAPLFFAGWLVLGHLGLGASPGQWLMRLRLRTEDDGQVSPWRGTARALLQWGWFAVLVVAYWLLRARRRPLQSAGVSGLGWAAGCSGAPGGAAPPHAGRSTRPGPVLVNGR